MAQEQDSFLQPWVARGLEGITAAATEISEVDGVRGKLTLRGYDISELAGRATYEEVAYLLWRGVLPNKNELAAMKQELATARELPDSVIDALKSVAPYAKGMHALRIGASMLSVGDETIDSLNIEDNFRRAARLQGQIASIVAHTHRIAAGKEIVQPIPGHGLAQGFLYMLEGEEPSQARIDGLNAYLVAVSEHGLNASTFAGRVTIATDSDMVSALTSAIGTLKGPKHGGVPGPVLKMLNAIGKPENADGFIRSEMAAGRRIMGFGHRVYKVRDPRAEILSRAAEKMANLTGDHHLFELTKTVEDTTVRVLGELKPGRDLYANVELYAALILHAVGVPSELFTPIFAIGRTSGWTAHIIEQIKDNRLIRPNAVYVGPRGYTWKPVDERS
jgi:citrate synthase